MLIFIQMSPWKCDKRNSDHLYVECRIDNKVDLIHSCAVSRVSTLPSAGRLCLLYNRTFKTKQKTLFHYLFVPSNNKNQNVFRTTFCWLTITTFGENEDHILSSVTRCVNRRDSVTESAVGLTRLHFVSAPRENLNEWT